jgi:hypothetical protein
VEERGGWEENSECQERKNKVSVIIPENRFPTFPTP